MNVDINYKYIDDRFSILFGVFNNDMNNLPANGLYYNSINHFNFFQEQGLITYEKANSKGVYINGGPIFKNGLWMNANATLFSLKYRDGETNNYLNSENNFGITANINAGKKINLKNSSLTFSTSYHFRGGGYQHPIIDMSIPTQLDYSLSPYERLGDYKRLDLRINYIRGKAFWSLDIQNVLNTLNDAYQYYDINGITTQKQLGMIPVLTYKYSF
jgi:hypothetical protein